MSFKVLIADDNEGMRLVLKKLVEKSEGFEIAAEAEDGETALCLMAEVKPEIVFLDVEMPVLSGVECAKKIMDINPKTYVIFATAHEEYMPEAFEVYAFDYIVKPFNIERIHQTLERIKEIENYKSESVSTHSPKTHKGLSKIMIRGKEGVCLINTDEIILIQREDRSTVIYTSSDRYVTSEGLADIEERLDKNIFFRCHKSYIINLTAVHKIYPYGRWTYIIKLKGTDKDALITHDKYEELQKIFS